MIKFIGNTELIKSELYSQSTIEECVDWLKTLTEVNLDTETEGFFNHFNKIVMLQLNYGNCSFVIDVRYIDILPLKEELEKLLIVGQNLKFDYKFCKFHGIEFSRIYDTFLAECCLTNGLENRKLGLSSISEKYLGKTLDKSVRNQFVGLKGEPFTEKQITYGVGDVECLTKIKELQLIELNKLDLVNWFELENKACLAIADIEYNGLKLDIDKWLQLADNVESKIPQYETELDNFVRQDKRLANFIAKYVQGDLFGDPVRDINIKWSSPTQMASVFKALGLDIPSTSEKEISKYQNIEPLIKRFIDYKKDAKLATTYGRNFINFINPVTNRVHGEFWQILNTARVSCGGSKNGGKSSVNLQNLPAKNEYLNCFVAEKGYKIIGIDYAAQEARIAASGSKDELWLNTFLSGKDLHSEVCKLMFNITDDLVRTKPEFLRGKTYRDAAKTLNFGVLFGMSKFKLSKALDITPDEAQKLIDKYFQATKQLKSYLDACANYGIKNGYIRSFKPFSFIRYFPQWKEELNRYDNFKEIGEITRASYNSPIQASGALMTKLALVKIRKYIKDNNLQNKVKLIHVVHDATYCEVIEEFAEEFSRIQSDLMIEAGSEFNLLLPMSTDICINDCWTK